MKKQRNILALTSTDNMLMFSQYFSDNEVQWQQEAEAFGLPYRIEFYEEWVPVEQFSLFVDAIAKKTSDEVLGLKVGIHSSKSLVDLHPELFAGDKAIETLVRLILEHSSMISRHVIYWIEQLDGHWCLCLRSSIKPHFPGSAQIEWFRAGLIISMCRKILGKTWQPRHLYLTTDERQGKPNEAFFKQTTFNYNHRFCAIELPLGESFTPYSLANSRTRNHLEEIELLAQTYAHIPTFSADWLASLFGITRKTLYRHLASHGKTFREIKEEARFNSAKMLLSSTDYSVDQISYQMGYSDLANFERAFKRWSGVTAARYRKDNQQE